MICAPRLVETMGHATALQTVPSWEVSRPEPAHRDSESAVYVSSQKYSLFKGRMKELEIVLPEICDVAVPLEATCQS